jgi:hypothetical protein
MTDDSVPGIVLEDMVAGPVPTGPDPELRVFVSESEDSGQGTLIGEMTVAEETPDALPSNQSDPAPVEGLLPSQPDPNLIDVVQRDAGSARESERRLADDDII